jgi:hypothetical protein
MSAWAKDLIGAVLFICSLLIHALVVTWIAGWKLGYNFRRMQDFGDQTNRNSVDIRRMEKELAAVTGVSNGVKYRKD